MKKNTLLKMILAISAFALAVAMISVQIKTNKLEKEQEELVDLLESYQNTIQNLENDLALPKDEYIEKYLREVLGYHRTDEIIFRNADETSIDK